jgi:hypothetical protein
MRKMKKLNHPIPFRGGELSIQGNAYAYCFPKSDEGPYTNVEVAHFDEKGDMVLIPELKDRADDLSGRTVVHGWVDVDRIKELLKSDGYTDANIEGVFDRINTVVRYD